MRISKLAWGGVVLLCALGTTGIQAQQPNNASPNPHEPLQQPPSSTSSVNPQLPQEPSSTPPANQQQPADKDTKSDPKPIQGTSNDRLFYALPNFLTLENVGKVPPLTVGQKFRVVTRGSFDPVQIPWYGFLAAISQAEDSEAGFGQGAAGYGKRYGAYAADGTIENYMVGAVFPVLLRQDPRYFQSGQGTFLQRTKYSVSRMFITRTDSGKDQFNYSEIVGSALASGISTYSYHPHADRTLANTLSVWGSQVGYDTITVVVKEFWPDIRRKISKNKKERPVIAGAKVPVPHAR